MMTGTHPVDVVTAVYEQPPYPLEGLPVITYNDRMQIHFNGERIELLHVTPAHTTGDTAVYFRNSNVIHMGDVFNRSYPFVDVGSGGDLEGMIAFCRTVLGQIDEDTVVIPGHGTVGSRGDLEAFVEMLETMAQRITAMIDRGMTLDEVIAAAPTAEFDATYGDPAVFLSRAYASLAR
jgi:glyoxylase-like metal-dependent hydrolase (beta-lactamase superfamily II)